MEGRKVGCGSLIVLLLKPRTSSFRYSPLMLFINFFMFILLTLRYECTVIQRVSPLVLQPKSLSGRKGQYLHSGSTVLYLAAGITYQLSQLRGMGDEVISAPACNGSTLSSNSDIPQKS
jgi:hypothetical protein